MMEGEGVESQTLLQIASLKVGRCKQPLYRGHHHKRHCGVQTYVPATPFLTAPIAKETSVEVGPGSAPPRANSSRNRASLIQRFAWTRRCARRRRAGVG